ncbi:MAG: DoxX family protein [Haloferacaceae archaeon]
MGMDGASEVLTRARATVRPLLRVGIAGLLLGPGASKVLTYERSVRFFTTLSLPVPEILVPVIGAVELGAATVLLTDRGSRIGAAIVVPVMLVAAATAGPTWQNLAVLLGALALVVVDTTRGVSVSESTT